MIGCLRPRSCKQPIIALYFELETVLKFYNLEAWQELLLIRYKITEVGKDSAQNLDLLPHKIATYMHAERCVICNEISVTDSYIEELWLSLAAWFVKVRFTETHFCVKKKRKKRIKYNS